MLKSRKRAFKSESSKRSAKQSKNSKIVGPKDEILFADENQVNNRNGGQNAAVKDVVVIDIDDRSMQTVFEEIRSIMAQPHNRARREGEESCWRVCHLGEYAIRLHDELAPVVQKLALEHTESPANLIRSEAFQTAVAAGE